MNRTLIVIGGPTASGKSRLAMALASHFNTSIISADSRQLYRGLDIGTAKPSSADQAVITHYFIDHLAVDQSYNAAQFAQESTEVIKSLFVDQQVVIVAGGTGLYLKAIVDGLDRIPEVAPAEVRFWEQKWHEEGLDFLHKELSRLDPVHAAVVDSKNPRRMIRALSVCSETGKPYSSFLSQGKVQRDYRILSYCLLPDRERLYQGINQRVDEMMASGLVREAQQFAAYQDARALQTVGYQELFPYFNGEYDLAEAIRLIKRNSRRYAKRQMTWFRNQGTWHFLTESSLSKQMQEVIKSYLDQTALEDV